MTTEQTPTTPKILVLDIETAPARAYVWSTWKVNVGLNQVIEPGRILSWAAKWIDDDEVLFASEFHDSRTVMLERMWELLEDADYVVGFNSAAFDIKWINAEFVTEGFPPPAPYQQIDLIKVARKNFRFLSNKLQHIADKLDIGSKIQHHGFELWRDCMAGDKAAWKLMKRYNKQDVKLTERLYVALLAWIDGPLNYGHFVDADVPTCPNCGSHDLTKLDKPARTRVSRFEQYRCNDCGKVSRERTKSGETPDGLLK